MARLYTVSSLNRQIVEDTSCCHEIVVFGNTVVKVKLFRINLLGFDSGWGTLITIIMEAK